MFPSFEAAAWIQIVCLHYSHARRAVYPAHNRRVVLPRRQRPDDRGLGSVARRQPARRNLRLLRGVIPVVVTEEKRAALEEVERRVREGTGDAKGDERGSDRANDHSLAGCAGGDHSTDQDVVSA